MRKQVSYLVAICLISLMFTKIVTAESTSYTLTIPCQFNGSGVDFYGNLAPVVNDGKFGLIDKRGQVIVPFQYDSIVSNDYLIDKKCLGMSFIAIKNEKFGVLNKIGKLVVPCIYDSISLIKNNYAIVGIGKQKPPGLGSINGKWGIVDINSGKEILPIKYGWITIRKESVFIVYSDNKMGLYNFNGKEIIKIGTYDSISEFSSGYAIVGKGTKVGAIDKTGKLVIPLKYNYISDFIDGTALVAKDNKYGIINKLNKVIVPINNEYSYILKRVAFAINNNHKCTIYDSNGKIITPAGKYDGAQDIESGKLIFVYRNNKFGAIDLSGKEVIPLIYSGVDMCKNGLNKMLLNDKSAIINDNGKIIVPLDKYEYLNIGEDGFIQAKTQDNKQNLIDSNGNVILSGNFYSFSKVYGGYVVTNSDKGYAIYNKNGDLIVPFGEFDYIRYVISENMVACIKNGLTGYISLPEYIEPPDKWAVKEVGNAISRNLIPENLRIDYKKNITRKEFCNLIIKLIEVVTGMDINLFMDTRGISGQVTQPISFIDTNEPDVIDASRLKIVEGIGNNKFAPNDNIKREEAAILLMKAANVLNFNKPNGALEVFTDRNEFSDYSVEAINLYFLKYT